MAKLRFILVVGTLFALNACAAYTAHEQLDALNHAVPSGSPFTQRLTVEYRDLANFDQRELMSYVNAEHFSRKGLKTAHGIVVPPENPADWSLSQGESGAILEDRQKLVDLLDNGGREDAPDVAAVAQARFDCWVERSEKSSAVEDQSVCRSQFAAAMTQLQAAIDKANKPVEMPKPVPTVSADELHESMFLVFFDWNRATITPAGAAVLDTIVSEANRLGAKRIDVLGHADLTGGDRYNQKLSVKRAQAVQDALQKRGVPAAEIAATGHGDHDPIVPTAKGIREPANRRAEIRFE